MTRKQRQDLRNRTEQEARRRISYEAVEASGTLPEIRRSQSIPGLKNIEGQDVLYWDGLYSQNPPVCQFVSDTPLEDVPDEIWVIRINPQRRNREPLALHDIDDRHNELSGNLSLNQELTFIQAVNWWVREDKERTGFAKNHKEIDIYMITMAKQLTDSLDLGSKIEPRSCLRLGACANTATNGRLSSSISGPPRRSTSWRRSSGRLVPWRGSNCTRASARLSAQRS